MNQFRQRREVKLKTEHSQARASRVPLIVACIAAGAALASPLLTWFLTERIRTSIQRDSLSLEKAKVDIAFAAQRAANAANQIAASRLELDRQIAQLSQKFDQKKVGLEERRTSVDETRLVTDFSKLVNDLRPNIEMSCDGNLRAGSMFELDCQFKNIGAQQVRIIPVSFLIIDRETQKSLPNCIERTENVSENWILPGGKGVSTYDLYFTPSGAKLIQPIIQVTVEAHTNQQAIDMTRRLSKGNITSTELESLSMQKFTYNLRLN